MPVERNELFCSSCYEILAGNEKKQLDDRNEKVPSATGLYLFF
jgi:hypothetical protein